MSGRAVRKALRQRELAALSQKSDPAASQPGSESEDEDEEAPPPQKQSLFALLNDDEPATDPDDEPSQEEEEVEEPVIQKQPEPTTSSKRKKRKKKKGKSKSSQPLQAAGDEDKEEEEEDEIDAALRRLNLKTPVAAAAEVRAQEQKSLPEILKIDSRNFDAANEMRHLFGRVALGGAEGEDAGAGAGAGGRRGGGKEAGKGRRGAAGTGRGMGRRNPFVQAKEEWPPGGSGGLGMEVVSSGLDGTTEFRFVHSAGYQDVQRQFMMCVASMDPNRLIQLLHHNPYHISTLLQASEIFAQQRDHTISGDLLERALYTFGRSLHSTFHTHLANGTARLSFQRPENREFWLCAFRYLRNLQMRGTWRTAEEFTRLLLALSPESDPYGMCLCIDFAALKARQPSHLLDLITHPTFRERYAQLPNMAYSTALAYKQLGQDPAARESLAKAIVKFPWVVSRLYSALGVTADLPSALWGVLPPEDDALQMLLAELYAVRSKDLWKEPETMQMLVDTAGTIYNLPKKSLLRPLPPNEEEVVQGVAADVARHVLVTDIPSVTALLPRAFTRRESPGYDPLPPVGEVRSYDVEIPDTAPGAVEGVGRAGLLREFLVSLFPNMGRGGETPSEEEVRRVLRERGIDLEVGDLGLGEEEEDVGRVRMM